MSAIADLLDRMRRHRRIATLILGLYIVLLCLTGLLPESLDIPASALGLAASGWLFRRWARIVRDDGNVPLAETGSVLKNMTMFFFYGAVILAVYAGALFVMIGVLNFLILGAIPAAQQYETVIFVGLAALASLGVMSFFLPKILVFPGRALDQPVAMWRSDEMSAGHLGAMALLGSLALVVVPGGLAFGIVSIDPRSIPAQVVGFIVGGLAPGLSVLWLADRLTAIYLAALREEAGAAASVQSEAAPG